METVLSGIRASRESAPGELMFGAVRNFVKMQYDYNVFL